MCDVILTFIAVTLLNSIGLLVFVMEMQCVFCNTGTEFIIVIEMN